MGYVHDSAAAAAALVKASLVTHGVLMSNIVQPTDGDYALRCLMTHMKLLSIEHVLHGTQLTCKRKTQTYCYRYVI
jgi:hypothetical protein